MTVYQIRYFDLTGSRSKLDDEEYQTLEQAESRAKDMLSRHRLSAAHIFVRKWELVLQLRPEDPK